MQLFDVSSLSSLIEHTGSPSIGDSSADDGDDNIGVSSSLSFKQGDYGLFSVDVLTGEYSYEPDLLLVEALGANEIVSDTFTVTVTDGDDADVTEDFSVLLVGAADAPSISAPQLLELDEDSPLGFSTIIVAC